jgi:hypothetical protein
MINNILLGITAISNLPIIIIFISVIKRNRGKIPGDLYALGILSIFSFLNEIALRVLAKYGLCLFSLIETYLSSYKIWSGSIVKSCGFYVVQNKYVANIFLINIYTVLELSLFIIIFLNIIGVKPYKIAIVIISLNSLIIPIHYKYFAINNIEVSISLIVIESVTTLILAAATLYDSIIKKTFETKTYTIDIQYGLVFFAIANLGYLVYQQAIPRLPLYFNIFFSITGNFLFYNVFRHYKRET